MTTRAISRLHHPAVFFTAAAGICAASFLIAGMLPRIRNAGAVAVGVTCDLVLIVPALYYLLLVRGRRWPAIGVVPVFIVCLLAASWILPDEHHDVLAGFEWAAAPLELGLLAYIGWRAAASIRGARRRLRGGGVDAFDTIREAARETIGMPRVADMLAQELAMFYYALASWKSSPRRTGDGFSSYRNSGYGVLLSAILIVLVLETIAIHVLVYTLWSGLAAWVLTGISLYTLVWMIGDWQALRLRLTEIRPDRIVIRLGTRWDAEIPRGDVLYVGPPEPVAGEPRPLRFALLGDPSLEIRLSRPVTARGPYGLRRSSTVIRLQLDNPDRFAESAGARGANSR